MTTIQASALESSRNHQSERNLIGRKPFWASASRETVIAESIAKAKRHSRGPDCKFCSVNKKCYYSELSDDLKPLWIAARRDLEIDKGHALFHSSTKPTGVYVVCSGKVAIEKTYRDGNSIIAHIAEPGEMIGDRAFFAGGTYWEDGIAMTNATVSVIDNDHFETMLGLEPSLIRTILKVRSRELGTAEKRAVSMAYENVADRVVLILAKRAKDMKVTDKRNELAKMVGISIEAFVRKLQTLEEDGMIKRDLGSITLTEKFVSWYNSKWFADHQKLEPKKK